MNFSLGDVLERMWKIGWNHKMLWLWQMLPASAAIFTFPFAYICYPFFMRLMQDTELQIPIEPWMSISLNSIGILFVLSYFLMWMIAQLMTIYSVVEIENGVENISFMEVFRKSLPYVWRVLGLYFLYCGAFALISIAFNPVTIIIARNFPTFLKSFITILSLPLLIVSLSLMVILELAQITIVVDNMSVFPAILHVWKIFKSNLLGLLLIIIVLYFIIVVPLGLLLMPLPFLVFTSLLFLTRVPDVSVVFFTVLFGVIPLVIILSISLAGIFTTFFQSAWTIAYLRMRRGAKTPIISEERPIEAGV